MPPEFSPIVQIGWGVGASLPAEGVQSWKFAASGPVAVLAGGPLLGCGSVWYTMKAGKTLKDEGLN